MTNEVITPERRLARRKIRQENVLNKMSANASDQQLLTALRQRAESAMDRLVERFASELTRAAYLYLGSVHSAEDVVQETFLAIWHAASRARPDTNLRPWLFGILFNQCRKHSRSARRRVHRERIVALQRSESQVSRDAGNEDRMDRLQQALAGLDETFRAVVILRYERGFSVAQAAEALGLPEGTIMSRTHSAIRKLRAVMDP